MHNFSHDNSSCSGPIVEYAAKYKLTIAIVFGIIGFIFNFRSIDFVFYGSHKMSFLPGLLFPMMITLAWSWKYGLLSALCSGCQTMWILWIGQSGYAPLISVPPFTLWIVWIGWFSRTKYNIYLGELIFRIFNTILLYTVFRWIFALNTPPTNVTMPISVVHSIVIKEMANGIVILFLAQGLLSLDWIRKFFKLPMDTTKLHSYYIYANAIVFGAVLVLVFLGEKHVWGIWPLQFQNVGRIFGPIFLLFIGVFCIYGVTKNFVVRKTKEVIQAQEKLQRTLKDLKCSNSELEQFAYVASHDLQDRYE